MNWVSPGHITRAIVSPGKILHLECKIDVCLNLLIYDRVARSTFSGSDLREIAHSSQSNAAARLDSKAKDY